LKICAVTTWPPHHDGVALYSAELYKQIAQHENVDVIGNVGQQKNQPEQSVESAGTWRRGLLYHMQVFRSVLKTRCNLVHVQHGWFLYGGFLGSLGFPVLLFFFRLSRKPFVVTMHTVIGKDTKIYSNYFANFLAHITVLWISRCIMHFSGKIIVHNRLMKQVLENDYNANSTKIVVIHHGVKQVSLQQESLSKHVTFNILSVGFLRKQKGIERLVEAFTVFLDHCVNAKLVFVGETHAHDKSGYLEDLKRRIPSALQKKVFFTGFVDDKTLENYIWESDVIVLQSEIGYMEASGTVAAVADYGKPLVCSKVPKFQSELQHGLDCFLFNPADSAELAHALIVLLNDSELRNRLGKNLKEKFRTHYWSAVAKQHVALYQSLLVDQKQKGSAVLCP
jgi:glycosyltransferase involved in cell wall biosynthesis